jgi:hypothetical protein
VLCPWFPLAGNQPAGGPHAADRCAPRLRPTGRNRESGSTSSGGGSKTPAISSPATIAPPTSSMWNKNGTLAVKSPATAVVSPRKPRLPGTSSSSPGVRTTAAGCRRQRAYRLPVAATINAPTKAPSSEVSSAPPRRAPP